VESPRWSPVVTSVAWAAAIPGAREPLPDNRIDRAWLVSRLVAPGPTSEVKSRAPDAPIAVASTEPLPAPPVLALSPERAAASRSLGGAATRTVVGATACLASTPLTPTVSGPGHTSTERVTGFVAAVTGPAALAAPADEPDPARW
jgi:hypothetical protein